MANPHQETRGGDGKYTASIDTARQDARAAELRGKGWTYQRIADELGLSGKGRAWDAVDRALKAIVQEPAANLRALELERLDVMYAEAIAVLERDHYTVAHGKIVYRDGEPLLDDGPKLQAIETLRRVSESRRKLLGMDEPAKTAISGSVTYTVTGVDLEQLK